MRFVIPLATFAALVLVVTGCDSGQKLHTVKGKVTFEGQPVDDGDITFRPDGGSNAPHGAKITGGEYQIKAQEGKYKVEIMATRTVPGKKGPMGEDFVEQYLPEKFNTKTTLTAEVKPGQGELPPFDLKK